MTFDARYDVVIAGGGLAGLCLAVDLRHRVPDGRILVVERSRHPQPEAAHKVGESSVEVGSLYFRKLGLSDALAQELPKFGLRFFMSDGENDDIAARLECGPSHFLTVPSFQIDRGQFENALADKARELGIDFRDGCTVSSAELGEGAADHTVRLEPEGGSPRDVVCRWLVDATGRRGLLKKRLGLARPNRHNANAAWFRIDAPIDLDEWSDDLRWRSRLKHSRRLSTNHLMGEGYWVWLIPLAHDRTSIGIVADERLHPFAELSSFDKALAWLDRHEPECADVVHRLVDERMDFRALKNFSYDVKQAFSADRWCVTGEAGLFVDPLYSPGSDFIGISNGFASDLIARELAGADVRGLAEVYDQIYRSLGSTYQITYHRQYAVMGSPRAMTTKVVWDFVMYWGGVALLYFRGKLCDPGFMAEVRPLLRSFAAANIRMQALFRAWAADAGAAPVLSGAFVDYAELGFLADLNRDLQNERDDRSLLAQLRSNLRLAEELGLEIVAEASRTSPAVAARARAARSGGTTGDDGAVTQHLAAMFTTMRDD